MKLKNYALGQWIEGTENGELLVDASTGEFIASASSAGLDFAAMMHYARSKAGPVLRKMTFHERGNMLKALAFYLQERKELFYPISYKTGATRIDSWIDIEGGIGNLFSNASLRKQFPNQRFYVDGDTVGLSKGGSFIGQHIMVPKEGVAIHINAFQFSGMGNVRKSSR
jgi:oxepin-CoA hydrolase/3-oxo-5,6-dehydrosuberyl-CoA semialdehyde dehydrogenase